MKKWWIYIALMLLAGGLIYFLLFRNNKPKDFPEIMKSGRITVVVDSSSLGFSVNKGSVGGFQYEIVKEFANRHGLELIISKTPDTEAGIEELYNGESQLLAHFIPANKENIDRLLLTKAFMNTGLQLVQKSDSTNIKSQLELADDTIYVAKGSVFIPRIKNLANEISSEIKIIELKNKSLEQMVEMVSRGEIKNTVCPEILTLNFKTRFSNLETDLPVGFQQEYGWAVHPNATVLRDSLNSFLNEFIGSSAYWEIYRKYQ